MQDLKPFFIFMGVVALILVAFASHANDSDQYDSARPICMPEATHLDAVKDAYKTGVELGQRQGYVQGGYAAAAEILDSFEGWCSKSGNEVELSNGITVVCK